MKGINERVGLEGASFEPSLFFSRANEEIFSINYFEYFRVKIKTVHSTFPSLRAHLNIFRCL